MYFQSGADFICKFATPDACSALASASRISTLILDAIGANLNHKAFDIPVDC